MVDRNELWVEAEELADLLIQSPELVSFREAERKMKENESALQMIQELRELQEQIGEFQSRNVPRPYYQHLEQKSELLLEKLDNIEEVRNFQESQQAVNQLLKDVTDRLSHAVMTRLSTPDEP
ncbi:YlbF family regulator [Alicyclobacillus tolerans]|uniref:YlbF family regulator n=1 Tax=Alicyclobacillus tolerans TaxID=90970 RepID=UPI001F277BA9|nr:YlbF family regulator [Alicyclobacillus tolerans]MCF8564510.1 YlbF family regulator [Alicyclobacillus tolerans]